MEVSFGDVVISFLMPKASASCRQGLNKYNQLRIPVASAKAKYPYSNSNIANYQLQGDSSASLSASSVYLSACLIVSEISLTRVSAAIRSSMCSTQMGIIR